MYNLPEDKLKKDKLVNVMYSEKSFNNEKKRESIVIDAEEPMKCKKVVLYENRNSIVLIFL